MNTPGHHNTKAACLPVSRPEDGSKINAVPKPVSLLFAGVAIGLFLFTNTAIGQSKDDITWTNGHSQSFDPETEEAVPGTNPYLTPSDMQMFTPDKTFEFITGQLALQYILPVCIDSTLATDEIQLKSINRSTLDFSVVQHEGLINLPAGSDKEIKIEFYPHNIGLPETMLAAKTTGVITTASNELSGSDKDIYLYVEPDSIVINGWIMMPGSFEIYSNINWTISNPCEGWIANLPTGGTGDSWVEFNFLYNSDTSARSCYIIIEGSGIMDSVYCSQSGHAYLNFGSNTKYVDANAGDYQINVQSNVGWSFSLADDWVNVLTFGNNNGVINVPYDKNTTPGTRIAHGQFIYSYEAFWVFYHLLQAPAGLCLPYYTLGCGNGNNILSFSLEDIQNFNSNCEENTQIPGWSQYLDLSPANLYQGNTHTLSLTSAANNTYVDSWIDFNNDSILTSAELIVDDYLLSLANHQYDIDFTIPADAMIGQHLLRVRSNVNYIVNSPCEEYVNGETEDYKVNINPPGSLALDIKVFLSGPFNGTNMTPFPNIATFPLSQPFNTAPWNYIGNETLNSAPNNNVVDWILLECRDAQNASSANSSTTIHRQAALVLNNGKVVNLDGQSNIPFDLNLNQNLFVVVWHRNHLAIISSNPVTQSAGVFAYDFTTSGLQAYGDSSAQIEVIPGVWAMVGADADANGVVDNQDLNSWKMIVGNTGYLNADFNLNGQVQNQDKNNVWLQSNGYSANVLDATLTDGLISYWKLDGDLTDSHGSNDGTAASGVTSLTSPGAINYAPYFNGSSNSYIICDNLQWLNNTATAITMCAWVYTEQANHAYIISKGSNYSSNMGYHLYTTNTNPTKVLANYRLTNGQNNVVLSQDLALNTWYHVVSTFDGTTGKIYINGRLVNTTIQSGFIGNATTSFTIGAPSADPTAWGYQWKGNIDEVGIWNRVLSPYEVSLLYNNRNGLQHPFLMN